MFTILLFPGLIFHEFSHYVMCRILGVKVKKVEIKTKSGYVQHVVPKSIIKSFLIATAPSLLALLFSVILLNIFFDNLVYEAIKFYVIYSFLYVSTPSKEDTNFLEHHKFLKKVLAFPFFVLFRLYYYISRSHYTKAVYSFGVISIVLLLRAAYELDMLDFLIEFFRTF